MNCADLHDPHNYQFIGLVYSFSSYPMSGSGARIVYYEDKFFCTKCLDVQYRNKREYGNSYMNPIPGSVPKENE